MKCIIKQKYYKSCNKNYLILLPYLLSVLLLSRFKTISASFRVENYLLRDLQVAKIALKWKSMAQTAINTPWN